MPAIQRLFPTRTPRRSPIRHRAITRRLFLQQLESRCLLASIGDWAYIDLGSRLGDEATHFESLTGVAFFGGQLAVVANLRSDGGDAIGHLVMVDYDLEANTADIAEDLTIPSLGGETHVDDVSSDGTTVYMTGYSKSDLAPDSGEAFRATYDGSAIASIGLGILAGKNATEPMLGSQGLAVNSNGVVVGTSDGGRAVFEYDQQLVHAGDVNTFGVVLGVSDDRVKVGISPGGVVWEADNGAPRNVTDPTGRGTGLYGISPDHSRLFGSSDVVSQPSGTVSEKLTWWTYEGVPTLVHDELGNLIDGRFTDGTNAAVGYYVAVGPSANPGDLLHMERSGETLGIEEWFEGISGVDIAALASTWGPEIAYDSVNGVVAIVSGTHALVVKINQEPVAANDSYETQEHDPLFPLVPLVVAAPGVLQNDVDDSAALQAVLVEPPMYGTLDLAADGSFVYTPNVKFNREDSFTYRASDGELVSSVAVVTITVNTARPWYNGAKPLDVSDDGNVSPVDALLGIDSLNSQGSRVLPIPRERPLAKPFYDTSRDGILSPIDVLLVIDYLNGRSSGQGEGEAAEASMMQDPVAAADVSGVSLSAMDGVEEDTSNSGLALLSVAMPAYELPPYETGFEPVLRCVDSQAWRGWRAASWEAGLESVLEDLFENLKID